MVCGWSGVLATAFGVPTAPSSFNHCCRLFSTYGGVPVSLIFRAQELTEFGILRRLRRVADHRHCFVLIGCFFNSAALVICRGSHESMINASSKQAVVSRNKDQEEVPGVVFHQQDPGQAYFNVLRSCLDVCKRQESCLLNLFDGDGDSLHAHSAQPFALQDLEGCGKPFCLSSTSWATLRSGKRQY